MSDNSVEIKHIRERLKTGKLTPEDAKFLDEMLAREDDLRKGVASAGRPIVAHLPFGMDIVK